MSIIWPVAYLGREHSAIPLFERQNPNMRVFCYYFFFAMLLPFLGPIRQTESSSAARNFMFYEPKYSALAQKTFVGRSPDCSCIWKRI